MSKGYTKSILPQRLLFIRHIVTDYLIYIRIDSCPNMISVSTSNRGYFLADVAVFAQNARNLNLKSKYVRLNSQI